MPAMRDPVRQDGAKECRSLRSDDNIGIGETQEGTMYRAPTGGRTESSGAEAQT